MWIVHIASLATPVPIYVLLLLAPMDADLYDAMKDDKVVLALAGLCGLADAWNGVREAAATARRSKARAHP